MGNVTATYINLDPNHNDSLTASKIYYDRTQTIKDRIDASTPRVMQITRTLKNALNGWVDVGYFYLSENIVNFILDITLSSLTFNVSKQYILAVSPSIEKNTWHILNPVAKSVSSTNNDIDILCMYGTDNKFHFRINRSRYNSTDSTNYEATIHYLTYSPTSLDFFPVEDRGITSMEYPMLFGVDSTNIDYLALPLREYLESLDATLIPNISNLTIELQSEINDGVASEISRISSISRHLNSINANINAKINNLIRYVVQDRIRSHVHNIEEIRGLSNIVNNIINRLATETIPGLMSPADKKKVNLLKFYQDKLDPSVIPSVTVGDMFYCDQDEIYFKSHLNEFVDGANRGDLCINSFEHKTYILIGNDWSNASYWVVFENYPFITDINQLTGYLPITRIEGNLPFTRVSGDVPFNRISGLPQYFPVDPNTLGTAAPLDVGTGPDNVILGNDIRLTNSRKCDNTFDDVDVARENLGISNVANLKPGTGPNDLVLGNDPRLHNTTISPNPPVDGNEGDIWYQYVI